MWKLIVLVVVVAAVGVVVFLRIRKKKKSLIQGHRKHPTGFTQYHDRTKTKIKRALNTPPNESKAEAERGGLDCFTQL